MKTKDTNTAGEEAVIEAAAAEVANTAVWVLKDRTKIGKAVVAAGACDFPLTLSDAQTLQGMGLVTITGLFKTTATATA